MGLNFCVAMGLRLSAIVRNAVCSPAFANSTRCRVLPKKRMASKRTFTSNLPTPPSRCLFQSGGHNLGDVTLPHGFLSVGMPGQVRCSSPRQFGRVARPLTVRRQKAPPLLAVGLSGIVGCGSPHSSAPHTARKVQRLRGQGISLGACFASAMRQKRTLPQSSNADVQRLANRPLSGLLEAAPLSTVAGLPE